MADSDDEDALLALAYLKTKSNRKYWVHPVNQKRKEQGHFNNLVKELEHDEERYRNYFRLNQQQFEYILSNIIIHFIFYIPEYFVLINKRYKFLFKIHLNLLVVVVAVLIHIIHRFDWLSVARDHHRSRCCRSRSDWPADRRPMCRVGR